MSSETPGRGKPRGSFCRNVRPLGVSVPLELRTPKGRSPGERSKMASRPSQMHSGVASDAHLLSTPTHPRPQPETHPQISRPHIWFSRAAPAGTTPCTCTDTRTRKTPRELLSKRPPSRGLLSRRSGVETPTRRVETGNRLRVPQLCGIRRTSPPNRTPARRSSCPTRIETREKPPSVAGRTLADPTVRPEGLTVRLLTENGSLRSTER
jgi:hypothetical protein